MQQRYMMSELGDHSFSICIAGVFLDIKEAVKSTGAVFQRPKPYGDVGDGRAYVRSFNQYIGVSHPGADTI